MDGSGDDAAGSLPGWQAVEPLAAGREAWTAVAHGDGLGMPGYNGVLGFVGLGFVEQMWLASAPSAG